jgi:nucleoside-diphosphate-sugar epimerase
MKFLVTGGAGFVGTNLVKRLLKDGHDVISFDNYQTGFKENEQDGCEYVNVNITDKMSLPWFFSMIKDIDVIFHMAALPRIKPSFENPKEVCDVNVGGTQHILEYARLNEIPVIYAGSSSFWGGVYRNPYTFSKWQGEELCKMYEQIYGLNVTICRFYNVYGEHMPTDGGYRTVLPIFLKQYKNGEPLTITGDGEQRRDFTHVDDIVEAMMRVVHLNKWGNTYELGRGENHSINEVAEMFRFGDMSHDTPPIKYIDPIPGEARDTLCRSELAREKLKWIPKINLSEWIKEQL